MMAICSASSGSASRTYALPCALTPRYFPVVTLFMLTVQTGVIMDA
jgi:hypothetical protein